MSEPAANGNLGVLVMGMHRSGTSAVAQALLAAGFEGGSKFDFEPAGPANPDGYAERREIRMFDDALLEALGWSWDGPPADVPPEIRVPVESVAAGRAFVAGLTAAQRPWLIKDPRLSLLMPAWRRITLDRFVGVVAYRAPQDVAWSLNVRDGMQVETGLALWSAYYRHLAVGARGLPIVVISYAALLDEPAQTIEALLEALRSLGVGGEFDVDQAVARIRPELRRDTFAGDPPDIAREISLTALDSAWRTSSVSVHLQLSVEAPDAAWWEKVLLGSQYLRGAELRLSELAGAEERRAEAAAHESLTRQLQSELDSLTRRADRLADELATARAATEEAAARHRAIEASLSAQLATLRRDAGITPRPEGMDTRRFSRRARVVARSRRIAADLPVSLLPERLATHPLFDAVWYAQEYPDTTQARTRGYRHYRRHGVGEGRNPNGYFDTLWYLEQNPDVRDSGMDPLDHYLQYGWHEGRDPSPRFSSAWYLERNPDVAVAGINPLVHYLRFGRNEDRLPMAPVAAAATWEANSIAPIAVLPMKAPESPAGEPFEPDVRLIALYLPQFHPIPENDEWWGPGFTEWRNVAAANPLFPGHYQPHIPGELGFYDLRLHETRAAQAELAVAHGIHGFCYYHYWFCGRQLLERPFQEVLESGEPRMPFALCWANDPWSRRWNGREDELLLRQEYSTEDDLAHIRALVPALADERAIRIDGRPIFLIYRAQHLPDARRTTDSWRTEIARAGLPGLYLIAVETAWDLGWDATSVGFDAKVIFQPQFGWLMTHAGPNGAQLPIAGQADLHVYDYVRVRDLVETIPSVPYRRYESVFPGWDNTARVGRRGVVLHGATPEAYEEWLKRAVGRARSLPPSERVVFVNAWNEWAEGCHLEPDRRSGRAYLEATRNALVSGAGAGLSV